MEEENCVTGGLGSEESEEIILVEKCLVARDVWGDWLNPETHEIEYSKYSK